MPQGFQMQIKIETDNKAALGGMLFLILQNVSVVILMIVQLKAKVFDAV